MLAALILAASPWVPLSTGVEWRTVDTFQVVRVSSSARLDVAMSERRTAAQWIRATKATAVINASMFQNDQKTSAGHLHCGKRMNQRAWSNDYQSVLAWSPSSAALPAFTVIDLDQAGAKETLGQYACAVQNLRLIRAPGESVWRAPPKKWAESALALDRHGRLLLVFAKAPLSMDVFIDRLLKSDLEIVRAMHLDGGPEASLSLQSGRLQLDFTAGDEPVALPNVLLVF